MHTANNSAMRNPMPTPAFTIDTQALRTDHQKKVDKLFSDFEKLKDSDEKKAAILTQICVEMTLQEHVEAEILAHAARKSEHLRRVWTQLFAFGNPAVWTELIGWSAATILLFTISRQVYTQWRDKSIRGVSKWLFIGQIAASIGFVIYSWLLSNWVFVVTNVLMLVTAGIGQWLYLKNAHNKK